MSVKLIVCSTIEKRLEKLVKDSSIEITSITSGLCESIETLHMTLQKEIDKADNDSYDLIILGFGLCGGIEGLKTKHTPLVVPKAHDCVTLLLGSRHRYRNLMNRFDGQLDFYYDQTSIVSSDSTCSVYIKDSAPNQDSDISAIKQAAIQQGKDFFVETEDLTLLKAIATANINEEDFIILSPNSTIIQSFDRDIIKSR